MALDPCDPCSCLPGNMSAQVFYQKALQALCILIENSCCTAWTEDLCYTVQNTITKFVRTFFLSRAGVLTILDRDLITGEVITIPSDAIIAQCEEA